MPIKGHMPQQASTQHFCILPSTAITCCQDHSNGPAQLGKLKDRSDPIHRKCTGPSLTVTTIGLK